MTEEPGGQETFTCRVALAENTVIPPLHGAYVQANLIGESLPQDGQGLLEVHPGLLQRYNHAMLVTRAIVQTNKGVTTVSVANLSCAPITLYAGTTLGDLHSLRHRTDTQGAPAVRQQSRRIPPAVREQVNSSSYGQTMELCSGSATLKAQKAS